MILDTLRLIQQLVEDDCGKQARVTLRIGGNAMDKLTGYEPGNSQSLVSINTGGFHVPITYVGDKEWDDPQLANRIVADWKETKGGSR